jgi:predicted MFS family arabinose efflux permease
VFVIKKNYLLFASTCFFCLGGNVLNFSLVYRLPDRFSLSPGQLGSYFALGQLFYFLGCNLYYRFGSPRNPAKIVPIASALVFLATIPLGYTRNIVIAYIFFWVYQISNSFFWPPIIAWATGGLNNKDLNREVNHYNRSWMGALIVGPLIAGNLYRWNSTANFVFVNFGFFLVVSTFFLMRLYYKRNPNPAEASPDANVNESVTHESESSRVKAAGSQTSASQTQSSIISGSRAADKRIDLYRYRGWLCVFISALFLGVLANIVPLHIRDGLGYTEGSMGLVLFFRCSIGFIGFTILARFSAWHFKSWWFIFLAGGLTFCSSLYLFAGNKLYFFCVIAGICGLMNSGCNTTSVFYSGATGKNPKKNIAMHEIFTALGSAAGSAGGGLMYQHFRFAGMSLALTMGIGLVLLGFILVSRKERVPRAACI